MFDTLIHADWSVTKRKRWIAAAERKRDGWEVAAPRRAPSSRELIEALIVKNRKCLPALIFRSAFRLPSAEEPDLKLSSKRCPNSAKASGRTFLASRIGQATSL